MKNSKVIAKAKKLGLTVECGHNDKYYIVHNGKVASWYGNRNGEGDAHLFHIKSEGQESDPYTDYYPGYFVDNPTQFFDTLVPPGSKFKPGTLIRGKATKRSQRYGYVGRLGLVVDEGAKQAKVQWVTPTASELRLQEQYPNSYNGTTWVSDRDLEVAA